MSQHIQSVINATNILKLFSIDTPYLSVTEIALRTGLSKGAVSKIMATLVSQDFVKREQQRGFSLGYTVINLAGVALTKNKIRELMSPILTQVAFDLKEDAHLAVLDGYDIIYLEKIYSTKHTKAKTILGGRNPAHSTSSGKILLASQNERFIKALIENGLQAFTEHTITNPLLLEKELKFIRSTGYAMSVEELTEGIASIAVPIKDYTNKVIASLSIVGSSKVLTRTKMTSLIGYLIKAGKTASEQLGYYK
ncbi:MAG: IclR family transcriptional regulator [Kurthia sp.]|nr:IclR family transcriptional regulator [Candidatus Kurthia equi]